MRLSIMQPYFLPYGGYFRLLAASDLFVVYDCVQFPRRGWVHRNRLHDARGHLEYLTLPLAKCPQETRIDALAFARDRLEEWREIVHDFPCFREEALLEAGITRAVESLPGTPVSLIVSLLETCCKILEIPFNIAYSSALNLPETLRGQERILAICAHFGAKTYVNAPGGRELYAAESFAARGIDLRFLNPYLGEMESIAERLARTPLAGLRQEIFSQCEVVP